MAVHAHSPHDFSTRIQSNVNDQLENHQVQYGLMNPMNFSHERFKGFAVASNPHSELTVNGRGLKKRGREESPAMDLTTTPIHFGGFDSNMIGSVVNPSITSTSGRISCSASPSSPVIPDLLVPLLYNQGLEIDNLIRLQNERLLLGLEQAQKRHGRSLISLFEQQLVKKLREKDAELESALRKNAELEERVRLMSAENQIWYNFAKNNEAIAANLKASLEQALLDRDGTAFPADEAQSCCFVEDGGERTDGAVGNVTVDGRRGRTNSVSCKVCRLEEAGVVLLPCRHLCLCLDCESGTNTCPVCGVSKNASLQIFMP